MADNREDDLEVREPEFEHACDCPAGWEDGYYGTGSTKPPKDHGWVVAIVLVLLILCSGLLTALSLMDIHLFHAKEPPEVKTSASFSQVEGSVPDVLEATEPTVPETTDAAPANPGTPDAQMELNPSPQGQENTPVSGALSWQKVYEKVIPSVVSITAAGQNTTSGGTGVIMTDDGYLITNAHVVEGASKIQVLLTDGRVFDAALVGADGISDLAVLFIDVQGLTPAEFGDSGALRVGDQVVAIGDPLGVELRGTMTEGIISAINRDLKIGGKTMTLLQTTAALNSGNSGGPLVNCYGQVIGINTMKIGDYATTSGVEGLGFAIPTTAAKGVVEQLLTAGYVAGRPTLGIRGQMLSSFYQYYYRMPVGLLITEVKTDAPAEKAGIQVGDLLLAINDTRITSANVLEELLYTTEVGQTITAVIYRGGREYQISLVVEEATG